ncbi:Phosphatidylinositol 3,4,5-trisphosphate-dependent Rac exchanger 2 protein [Polyrhizophydium stewartii]|uniref:Phosphatidylinositol 3,4,5-trisphosphate-dependent Rac exchanger 2 protein n=1 Tax=Polyrhizophydium stewartii TaxID=2732419 RepID=A0ABR4MX94_9FUNG
MPTAPVSRPLVWVDLEMTGLDLDKDTIIEIACIITDGDLNPVEEQLDLVIHHPRSVMDNMNEWCIEHHGESGLTQAVLDSTLSLADAEKQVLEYVKRYAPTVRSGVLAGNSVHVDRQFLCKYMPTLVEHLHYRIVDVSTVKELGMRWYPEFSGKMPRKKMAHRALGDILESIEELKWYRANVFRKDL